jgi:hypothetical protein
VFIFNVIKSTRSKVHAPADPWKRRHARVVDPVAAAGFNFPVIPTVPRRDPSGDEKRAQGRQGAGARRA